MTSSRMGRLCIEEAASRMALVRLAVERGLWATVVREAQECVELFLKGPCASPPSSRPAPTTSPSCCVARPRASPSGFRTEIDRLAAISTEMAGDRGIAFHGDERRELAPPGPLRRIGRPPGGGPPRYRRRPLQPTPRRRARLTTAIRGTGGGETAHPDSPPLVGGRKRTEPQDLYTSRSTVTIGAPPGCGASAPVTLAPGVRAVEQCGLLPGSCRIRVSCRRPQARPYAERSRGIEDSR